jgi:hypothetical protein
MVKFTTLTKLTDPVLQEIVTDWLTRSTGKRSAICQPAAALNVERVDIFARLAILAATC